MKVVRGIHQGKNNKARQEHRTETGTQDTHLFSERNLGKYQDTHILVAADDGDQGAVWWARSCWRVVLSITFENVKK
jgi:hypothetical protein